MTPTHAQATRACGLDLLLEIVHSPRHGLELTVPALGLLPAGHLLRRGGPSQLLDAVPERRQLLLLVGHLGQETRLDFRRSCHQRRHLDSRGLKFRP